MPTNWTIFNCCLKSFITLHITIKNYYRCTTLWTAWTWWIQPGRWPRSRRCQKLRLLHPTISCTDRTTEWTIWWATITADHWADIRRVGITVTHRLSSLCHNNIVNICLLRPPWPSRCSSSCYGGGRSSSRAASGHGHRSPGTGGIRRAV